MDPARVREYFAPSGEETLFRQELSATAAASLAALGGVEILSAIAVFGPASTGVAAAAFATVALSRWRPVRAHPWLFGAASVICVTALLALSGGDGAHLAAAAVLVAASALVPFRPWQMLAVGMCAWAVCAAIEHAACLPLITLAPAAVLVSAAVYAQRRANYDAHRDALRVSETLTSAQLRAQLAENAAAIGKLAAALTHEINTPLGALKSSIDTLLVVAGRQATAPPETQARLVGMQAELRRSIQISAERIQGVIQRLQRFINLEEAELKQANLNELIGDVGVLMEGHIKPGVKVEYALQPLPLVTCRPQLLSAVFSSLLSNALNAVDSGGRIVVSTGRTDGHIRIAIADDGRGMSPEELEGVFDPGFKVADQRVSSGNWSLFNTRQIVYEHGGDIQIESAPGKGTTVTVLLPS